MKPAPEHLIFDAAAKGNILPLTSTCNVSCIFCSHHQNPPQVQTYTIPHRTLQQVEDTLQFMTPGNKIVIGESVTKVIEGEPFTHPLIKEILTMVRLRFPNTVIQITTNGTMINQEMANFLAEIGSLEVNLSLNSANPTIRQALMKDNKAQTAVEAPVRLARAGVSYHGSVVAMPHRTGWGDLRETLQYLSDSEAMTARVFMPGFAKLAPKELTFAPGLWNQLAGFIDDVQEQIPMPLTVEPAIIKDLRPRVRGVIKGTPAARAGLIAQDIICSVNGHVCLSRVDAFHKIRVGGQALIEVDRAGRNRQLSINKSPGAVSGLVMDYDLDPDLVSEIERAARKHRKVKLLCSVLGENVLNIFMAALDRQKYEIIPVKNVFFGGSVMVAGLLTVSDFLEALHGRASDWDKSTALFLPAVAFDRGGRDLTGVSYSAIEDATGLKVEII